MATRFDYNLGEVTRALELIRSSQESLERRAEDLKTGADSDPIYGTPAVAPDPVGAAEMREAADQLRAAGDLVRCVAAMLARRS